MSYRIDYEPHKDKLYPAYQPRKRRSGVFVGCMLCAVLLFGWFIRSKPSARNTYNDSMERLCIWVQEETEIGHKTTEYARKLLDYEIDGE